MKLSSLLPSIKQIAFDTAPLIYFIEKHPVYFNQMRVVMQVVHQGYIVGVCSTVALTEVLVHPLRSGDTLLAQQYERVLSSSQHFNLEPLTQAIARQAAQLRVTYGLKIPDSLHVATAIETGCDAFLTNDTGIKRIRELNVLILDELDAT